MARTNLRISKIMYDLAGKWQVFQGYLNIPAGSSDSKSFTPEDGKVFIPLSHKIGFSVNYFLKFSLQFDSTYTFKEIRLTDALRGDHEFDLYTPVNSRILLTVSNEDEGDHNVDFIISGILLSSDNVSRFFEMLERDETLLSDIRDVLNSLNDSTTKMRELQIAEMKDRGIDTNRLLRGIKKIAEDGGERANDREKLPHPVSEKPYRIVDGRLRRVDDA